MGLYTIKEIETIIHRTAPTIYAFMRSDEEMRKFFNQHRQERQRGGYLYDDDAIELLKMRFCVEDDGAIGANGNAESDIPLCIPPMATQIDELSQEKERLTAELEDLKGKLELLQEEFDKVKAENSELLRQNGNLLLLLSQEKAEKQALLPAPRRSIGERLKSIFKKKEGE